MEQRTKAKLAFAQTSREIILSKLKVGANYNIIKIFKRTNAIKLIALLIN